MTWFIRWIILLMIMSPLLEEASWLMFWGSFLGGTAICLAALIFDKVRSWAEEGWDEQD